MFTLYDVFKKTPHSLTSFYHHCLIVQYVEI